MVEGLGPFRGLGGSMFKLGFRVTLQLGVYMILSKFGLGFHLLYYVSFCLRFLPKQEQG